MCAGAKSGIESASRKTASPKSGIACNSRGCRNSLASCGISACRAEDTRTTRSRAVAGNALTLLAAVISSGTPTNSLKRARLAKSPTAAVVVELAAAATSLMVEMTSPRASGLVLDELATATADSAPSVSTAPPLPLVGFISPTQKLSISRTSSCVLCRRRQWPTASLRRASRRREGVIVLKLCTIEC